MTKFFVWNAEDQAQRVITFVGFVAKNYMFKKNNFCEKCGFQKTKSDNYCGGCGKELISAKKNKNYAELFLFFGFLLSLGKVFEPMLGFNTTGSAEALGENFATAIFYLMYLIGGTKTIIKARKKDMEGNDQGAETDISKTNKNFPRALTGVAITACILIAAVSSSIYTNNKSKSVDVTPILEDAIYGTKQSQNTQYVSLISEILKSYNESANKRFPSTIALDSSDILEFESFETKTSLQSSISLLEASIAELDKADQSLLEAKEEAKTKIRNSSLSEKEKVDVLNGFNKSANNAERVYQTQRRYQTLKETYEEMLKLYEFLYLNFDGYKIDFDDNNEENIFFYSDNDIEIYDAQMADIQKASLRFAEAEKALLKIINEQLKSEGISINAEDIQNYYKQ